MLRSWFGSNFGFHFWAPCWIPTSKSKVTSPKMVPKWCQKTERLNFNCAQQTNNLNQRRKGNLGLQNCLNKKHFFTFTKPTWSRHVFLADDIKVKIHVWENQQHARYSIYIYTYMYICRWLYTFCGCICIERQREREREKKKKISYSSCIIYRTSIRKWRVSDCKLVFAVKESMLTDARPSQHRSLGGSIYLHIHIYICSYNMYI